MIQVINVARRDEYISFMHEGRVAPRVHQTDIPSRHVLHLFCIIASQIQTLANQIQIMAHAPPSARVRWRCYDFEPHLK
jgi:hypothetical protein